jgi:hypothetical protein
MTMATLPLRCGVGLLAGVAISLVDNVAFEGEVSPIVIVGLLFAAGGVMGAAWGRAAWAPSLVAWACLPLVHVAKHVAGLPDTLHPNTWASIAKLAVFTWVVTTVATGAAALLRGSRTTSGG